MRHDLAERLAFIESGQAHCDCYLSPIAVPAGKSVLVAGCGAGTEMVWCLRRGATEVVGIDILEQDPEAFQIARRDSGIEPSRPAEILRLDIGQIESLGRTFDLVVSNNVFEHLTDPVAALAACARALDPARGRLAIFSDPLFYSSVGSHLEHEPWEHLWGDLDDLRDRQLALPGGAHPALTRDLHLDAFFDREITLNRLRLVDFLEAFRRSGLVLHHLGVVADRNLSRYGEFEERLRANLGEGLAVQDLTTEGFAAVLAHPTAASSPLLSAQVIEEVSAREVE